MSQETKAPFYYFVICISPGNKTNPKYFLFRNECSVSEFTKAERMARADIDRIISALSEKNKIEYIAFVDHIAEYSYKVLKKYFPLYTMEDDN